jgi:hypothetical protein
MTSDGSERTNPDVSNCELGGLPVAAVFVENTEEAYYSDIYFGEEGFNRDNTHDLQYFRDSDTHNVVECTRVSDAEDAVEKARKQAELHTLLQDQYRTEEARDERIEHLRDELDSESNHTDSAEEVFSGDEQ